MAPFKAQRSELYGIQMLRALAAVAVVCHHAFEQSNGAVGHFSPDWLTTSGASGVDIFFVISGFIMLHVSYGEGRKVPTAGEFLFRRATRIYPFYWLCCIATLLISAMGFLASHQYGAWKIFTSFLLLPGDKLIGVSWTLVFEIYFYLLFAATLMFRSAMTSMVGTSIAVVLILAASPALPAGDFAKFFANPLPIEFCAGLVIAFAYSKVNQWPRWQAALPVAALGIALLAVAPMFVTHPDTTGLPPMPRIFVWGIPAALIVAGSLTIGKPSNLLTRFWVLLGDASYALYLIPGFTDQNS